MPKSSRIAKALELRRKSRELSEQNPVTGIVESCVHSPDGDESQVWSGGDRPSTHIVKALLVQMEKKKYLIAGHSESATIMYVVYDEATQTNIRRPDAFNRVSLPDHTPGNSYPGATVVASFKLEHSRPPDTNECVINPHFVEGRIGIASQDPVNPAVYSAFSPVHKRAAFFNCVPVSQ